MIYFIKLQPTAALVDFVLNNSKRGTTYRSLSSAFRRRDLAFSNSNFQEFSTYVSALKTLPTKKISKKKENVVYKNKAIVDIVKLNKILRKNKKEKNVQNIVEKKVNNGFESIQSYDPNLIKNKVEIKEFFKKYDHNKILEGNSLEGSEVQKKSENLVQNNELHQKNHAKKIFSSENINNSLSEPFNSKLRENLKNSKINMFALESLNQLDKELLINEAYKELEETKEIPVKEINGEPEPEPEPLTYYYKKHSFLVSSNDNLIQFLHSSIDIWVTNDSVLKAFELLNNTRRKNSWKNIIKEKNNLIDVYNTLLHGFAEKGHWNFIQKVTAWMAADGVKLNSESFAALFYALTKFKEMGSENFIQDEFDKVLNQLFVNNISLNDIFSKTTIQREKAEKILALIQRAIPSFEVKPVTINLSSECPLLKDLFESNSNLESPIDNVGIETMRDLVEEQWLLEKQFLIDVKAVQRNYNKETPENCKKKMEELKMEWRRNLEEKFLNIIKSDKHDSTSFALNAYLKSIPPEKIIDILMDVTIQLIQFSKGYSPNTIQVSFLIANKISSCYQLRKRELNKTIDKTKDLFKNYLSWYLDPCGPARNSRQKWQMLTQIRDKMCVLDSATVKWPDDMRKKLGRFLLNFIINEVKFPFVENSEEKFFPVLCTVLRYREGTWREEIKCHPVVSELQRKLGFDKISFRADQMPMVCPPKPWKSVEHGGYLCLPTDFIRKSTYTVGKILKLKNVPSRQLFSNFDALNALQMVPWMINEEVLDVALEVFKKGGSQALKVPHYPKFFPNEFSVGKSGTYEERWEEVKRRKQVRKMKNEEFSLWCEALYKFSLANHFRKRFFWLPQNCDFRGRVYPAPNHLNHLGCDLYRSFLKFAKGKPLGPDGLDWLKIHVINLTGTHKNKSVKERLAHANELLPRILDSAEEPLKGKKWWKESEEPWQTLAACIEIKKALSVPNPEHYVCNFPVHQDGSCNGLQHYAGLGKDTFGAKSVNLTSNETPKDVYSVVAGLIEEEREKDAKNGIEVAIRLKGFISRKIVKQTIMTTVYGVTAFGARGQISRKLEEIPNFSEENIKPAAAYLSNKTFLCLRKMFSSAKEIQDWLVGCANGITRVGDYVQWVSPLGLPILQGYGREKFHYNSQNNFYFRFPDTIKQKNAFPPNFIHCLDSSHMMLTALFCEQAGITFAAVHDCFWTHPNTVGLMNKICREQFISLHSQPILENLSQYFIRNYLKNKTSNNEELADIFQAIPAKGSFDLREVLNSVYFFN